MGRRNFLKRAAAAACGIITATTLSTLSAHSAWAQDRDWADKECRPGVHKRPCHSRPGKGYGPLARTCDQNGQEILALPAGFQYVTFSKTGDMMSDGYPTPCLHDGMTCFETQHGLIRLIRNHELRNSAGDFTLGVLGSESARYDLKGMGGCVTLDFDPQYMQLVRSFGSINGTIVNCAGGLAYNDAGWLTCEETTSGLAEGFTKPHGYVFMVPKDLEAPVPAQPFTAMGRFAHEAAVADNASGIVYMTEDAGNNSGFYRFLPNDPTNLLAGGVLQMLKVRRVTWRNAMPNLLTGGVSQILKVHRVTNYSNG